MFDFCINGAGMVGAATALGLLQQGYKVALIEPAMPQAYSPSQPPDLRMSAISIASVELLEALGAWKAIEAMRVRPYHTLAVWDNPKAETRFSAQDLGLDKLGYFVENRLVQLGLHTALAELAHSGQLTWFCQDPVKRIDEQDSGVVVTLSSAKTIEAKWLIGADGANSQVRQAAGIGTTGWDYAQQAMGIIIETPEPVDGVTWQQFYPTGPRALLPMHDNYASLIWYDSSDKIKQLKTLSPIQLEAEIKAAFPAPTPADFKVLNAAAFPLTRRHASHYVKGRSILIGDAAHTINPLAGQGVNLGFKDVKALLAVTAQFEPHQLAGLASQLQSDYEAIRKKDNLLMMSAMDGFYALFSNDHAPLSLLRNSLLAVAQRAGVLKNRILKYALGLA